MTAYRKAKNLKTNPHRTWRWPALLEVPTFGKRSSAECESQAHNHVKVDLEGVYKWNNVEWK
jgi:hypothetical protein